MDQFKEIFFNIRVKNEFYLLMVLASKQQLDRGLEINSLFKVFNFLLIIFLLLLLL